MKFPNRLSPGGPSGSVVRGDDRAVSELVGTILLITIVVTVVAVLVAVVAPQLRSLRDQGTVDAARATMVRLGQRIVDLSRTDLPRSEQARIDLPPGRLDAMRRRICWVATATVPGPERLDFTLSGVGDADGRYGIEVEGADGVGAGTDDPTDLVVRASLWQGNQRRALAESRSFEVGSTPTSVSLALETRDGTPVPPCSGRVRLRVVAADGGNVTGEAWVLASDSLRWQASLQDGVHAVEVLAGARVVEAPGTPPRLSGFDAVRTGASSVTVEVVRLTVPEAVPTTLGAGEATVPMRGTGAFSLADGSRGNVTLAFHGAWNATFRERVREATAFAPGPAGALTRAGTVSFSTVDRPVTLPEGLVAR